MMLTIHTDGGSRGNPGPAAIGVVVQDMTGTVIHSHNAFLGVQTNNTAEYEALIYALEWLRRFCSDQAPHSARFLLDSKLVVEQVSGHWKVKEAHLKQFVTKAQSIISSLPISITLSYVPRAQNTHADSLVNQALDKHSA